MTSESVRGVYAELTLHVKTMTVGERLAEERARVPLGVGALAEACGVSRDAQRRFESGENLPGGAYLIAAAAQGVDVRYVLTGERGITRIVKPLDVALLADCLSGVEAGLKAAAKRMAAKPKAKLIAEVYALFAERGGATHAKVLEFVQRAA